MVPGVTRRKSKLILASIGQRIRDARVASGITLSELANRLDTDKGTVSRIERGLLEPGTVRLSRIAEILQIPVTDLLHE